MPDCSVSITGAPYVAVGQQISVGIVGQPPGGSVSVTLDGKSVGETSRDGGVKLAGYSTTQATVEGMDGSSKGILRVVYRVGDCVAEASVSVAVVDKSTWERLKDWLWTKAWPVLWIIIGTVAASALSALIGFVLGSLAK
jgi:hypothetical protein